MFNFLLSNLHLVITKVKFLSDCEKVLESQKCPGICLKDFSPQIILGKPFCLPILKNVPELTRITQNQTGDG